MDWIQEFQLDKELKELFFAFFNQYGAAGLKQALQSYKNMQKEYICKTKSSVSRISINDIYYMTIQQHHIVIHTRHDTFQKYGTLNKELESLSCYGFVKCAQNCIVSLSKIKTIGYDYIILINDTVIHMSKRYASKIIAMYMYYKNPY